MPEIERRRKKPLVVDVLLWDGTNYGQVRDFAGGDPEGGRNAMLLQSRELAVWNNQEQAWFDIPVGHYVVRGALGELYGLSPEAYATTYEPDGDGRPAAAWCDLGDCCVNGPGAHYSRDGCRPDAEAAVPS